MGEIFVAALTLSGAGDAAPTSVVVKLPAAAEENRQQGIALGMYEAEVRFYSELVEATGAGVPAIYHSNIVSGTGDFVIVMEDLSHLEQVEQSKGMSVEQARAGVVVLADIHTAWWGKVQGGDLDWIPSMDGDRIAMVNQMLPDIWTMFLAGFEDRLPPGGKELGAVFSQNYLKLMAELSARSPWTMAHQDYRVENMMFGDPTKNEVVVIDWQGMGRGPGAYDLAYFLGGSLTIENRRAHEEALVGTYHERLVANGIGDYTAEQCWNDYRYAHLLGGLAVSIFGGGTLDLSNERGFELMADMANRHMTAALDHGGFDMSETVDA